MGEAKRRTAALAADLTKDLIDNGKLIEAGFAVFANIVIPRNAPTVQLVETQLAFMAGAEHVWSSMMSMLDPEQEPTDADLRRMDLIQRELDEWRGKLKERINQPKAEPQPPPHQHLGDGPVEEQYAAKMTAVARTIDEFFNGQAGGPDRKTGFVLMVFPFDDHSGRCNYMSNGADRKDIVVLFREMIARFEGQPEASGRA